MNQNRTDTGTTGAAFWYANPSAKNSSGNKQNGYRRFICWVFRKRDNSQCQVCGQDAHNVHHILPKRDYPHFKKEAANVLTLCIYCHDLADADFFSIKYLFSCVSK